MDKNTELAEMQNKIVEGLELTYQKLVEFKRYKNSPLIVSKDGEIIEIPPDKIPPTARYITYDDK